MAARALGQSPVLPAPPVLTPPMGWLGFLGIKSGGRQPEQSLAWLTPTLDMRGFYAAGARSILAGVSIANVNNVDQTIGTVPQGKVWNVEYVSILSGALGAAATVQAWIRIVSAQANAVSGMLLLSNPTPIGATGNLTGVTLAGPLALNAGDAIKLLSTAPAAPTAFNWVATVYGQEVSA